MNSRLDLFAADLWQFLEFLVANDLATLDRGEHVARRRLHDADTFGSSHGLERLPLPLDFFLGLGFDRFELVAVIVALEGGRNREAHIVDQCVHVSAKFAAETGRESQCRRPFRIHEIIDVAPVARCAFCCRALAHELANQAVPMAAQRAEHENVVAGPLDVDAEADRVDGALLTEIGFGGRQFGAAAKSSTQRLASFAQVGAGHRQSVGQLSHHAKPSCDRRQLRIFLRSTARDPLLLRPETG